jgi:hypothetical protein
MKSLPVTWLPRPRVVFIAYFSNPTAVCVTSIAAGEFHSLFIKSDGSLWAMGMDNHSLFLKSDGSLWAMGDNYYGQIGDGLVDYDYPFHGTDAPEQIFPAPSPMLMETVSGTDLQFTADCGFGGEFHLLSSTNAAVPRSQWLPVWTNVITYRSDNPFFATLSNAVNPCAQQQFFILQSK